MVICLLEREQFIKIVAFEKSALPRILEDFVGQKLFEYLAMIDFFFNSSSCYESVDCYLQKENHKVSFDKDNHIAELSTMS